MPGLTLHSGPGGCQLLVALGLGVAVPVTVGCVAVGVTVEVEVRVGGSEGTEVCPSGGRDTSATVAEPSASVVEVGVGVDVGVSVTSVTICGVSVGAVVGVEEGSGAAVSVAVAVGGSGVLVADGGTCVGVGLSAMGVDHVGNASVGCGTTDVVEGTG